MRVLLVSLARRGGMVHFHAELANALARRIPVESLQSSSVPGSYLHADVARATVDTGTGPWSSLGAGINPGTWYRLWKELSQTRAELIHLTGTHPWNPMVGSVGRLLGKKLVYTVHDPEEHRGSPLSIRLSNLLTIGVAEAVVVLTRTGRQQLLDRGIPAAKVHVIPHGIYEFFRQKGSPAIRSRKVVLYFGRFEPYKGIEVLVQAYGRIRQRFPAWRLVIAGAGGLPSGVVNRGGQGVEIHNGFLPDDSVANLMRRARLVVVPYTEATQSGVIAAAYAFDRPVVATRVGGLAEMVQHGKTGLLVRPNDAGALARAMRTLMGDPERLKQMAHNVRTLRRGRFQWDRIAQAHEALYARLLGEPTS
jgi:starch synthase